MKNKHKIKKYKSLAKNIPKQQSVSKNNNFLNNQKYIFNTSDKRKILGVFFTQNLIQTIASYLWVIESLVFFVVSAELIYITARIYDFIGNIGWGTLILIILSLFATWLGLIYRGVISIKKTRIVSFRDYFFKENNAFNVILWYVFFLLILSLIIVSFYLFSSTFQAYCKNYWAYFVLFGPLFISILKDHDFHLSDSSKHIYLFRLNIINILIFPLVAVLCIVIFVTMYAKNFSTKYQVYKLKPHGKIMEHFGFREENTWTNGFYEITKK